MAMTRRQNEKAEEMREELAKRTSGTKQAFRPKRKKKSRKVVPEKSAEDRDRELLQIYEFNCKVRTCGCMGTIEFAELIGPAAAAVRLLVRAPRHTKEPGHAVGHSDCCFCL